MIEEFDKAWEQLLHKIEHVDDATSHRTGRFMIIGGTVAPIYGPSGGDPMMLSVSHKKME